MISIDEVKVRGDQRVQDVDAGRSITRVAGDFDNDGFNDLFSWSRLELYHNQGGTNEIYKR